MCLTKKKKKKKQNAITDSRLCLCKVDYGMEKDVIEWNGTELKQSKKKFNKKSSDLNAPQNVRSNSIRQRPSSTTIKRHDGSPAAEYTNKQQ